MVVSQNELLRDHDMTRTARRRSRATLVGMPSFHAKSVVLGGVAGLLAFTLGGCGTDCAPSRAGVGSALHAIARDTGVGTLGASVVTANDAAELWSVRAGTARTPGSNVKLLTAAAALLEIGPDARIETKVVAGRRPGAVVLVGGGDPTLAASAADPAYPGAADLDSLAERVRSANGESVETVGFDDSEYVGPVAAAGWAAEDTPSSYAGEVVPLMLDGARRIPSEQHSQRVHHPEHTAVRSFASRLGAHARTRSERAPAGTRSLGTVHSAPMGQLVRTMLTESDNNLAEAIGRRVAIHMGERPSFTGTARAILRSLAANGLDVGDVALFDASGLSTMDKVPPDAFSEVLGKALRERGVLQPLLDGLPVAGQDGTLRSRFARMAGNGWVHAKTGSLDGVDALSGYVPTGDGATVAFSFIVRGGDHPTARRELDRLASRLRRAGCSAKTSS